jgi:hypothetical protein
MINYKSHKICNLPLFAFFMFFMINCSIIRKSPPIEKYDFEIHFGSIGGFTNTNPVYTVKSNGEVMKKDKFSDSYVLKRINRHKVDSLFLLIRNSNFNDLKIKQISNFTNYIEIQSVKCTNKVMWFDDSQIPVEVKKLYGTLIGIIQK